MTVAYVSDGNHNPARGTRGGLSGANSAQYRRRVDGSLEPLPACAEVEINEGEAIVSVSGGGGGYGSPRHRTPDRVQHDVEEGWVSRDRAASVYGVILTDNLVIEEAATAAARAVPV